MNVGVSEASIELGLIIESLVTRIDRWELIGDQRIVWSFLANRFKLPAYLLHLGKVVAHSPLLLLRARLSD